MKASYSQFHILSTTNCNSILVEKFYRNVADVVLSPDSAVNFSYTVEPGLGGLCHERPPVLNDRFHRRVYMGREYDFFYLL